MKFDLEAQEIRKVIDHLLIMDERAAFSIIDGSMHCDLTDNTHVSACWLSCGLRNADGNGEFGIDIKDLKKAVRYADSTDMIHFSLEEDHLVVSYDTFRFRMRTICPSDLPKCTAIPQTDIQADLTVYYCRQLQEAVKISRDIAYADVIRLTMKGAAFTVSSHSDNDINHVERRPEVKIDYEPEGPITSYYPAEQLEKILKQFDFSISLRYSPELPAFVSGRTMDTISLMYAIAPTVVEA